jgi:glycosyltransferase involved in cell wall biosynthesis
MRCPTLEELPPPNSGRVAWPWTEESPRLPARMPDGSPWPRVSIITPSYNQGTFIEECIRSVLLQGYPDLEYVVVDGGSTDETVEILKKYEPWLAHWVSEPDRGQSDALNKGLDRTTGEILGWINSDDLYCAGAINHVVELLRREADAEVAYGGCYVVDTNQQIVDDYWAMPFDPRFPLYSGIGIHQQALFWRRSLMDRVGRIDDSLVFCMDRDFILRLIWNGRVTRTTSYLGMFRVHSQTKTRNLRDVHYQEWKAVQLRYRHYHTTVLPAWFWQFYVNARRRLLIARESGREYVFAKLRRKLK